MRRTMGRVMLAFFLLGFPKAFSDFLVSSAIPRGALHVKIVGLPSSVGAVRIGLYHSKESYAAHAGSFRKAALPVLNHACDWVVEGVPYGEYAVMFYHDRNDNHRLDRNVLGIPTEPFGFSNNAAPRLGLPAFDQVKFDVDTDPFALEIRAQAR